MQYSDGDEIIPEDRVVFIEDYFDVEWNQTIKKGTVGIAAKIIKEDIYQADVIYVLVPSLLSKEERDKGTIDLNKKVFQTNKAIVCTTRKHVVKMNELR